MNVPSKSELTHLRLQAFLREYSCSDIQYVGEKENNHWYKIDGHLVSVDQIVDFEQVD